MFILWGVVNNRASLIVIPIEKGASSTLFIGQTRPLIRNRLNL
jgi:hypothetical protein